MLELKLDRVSKLYKNKQAVDTVTYTFSNGVNGLLGANGAGKTTLLRMICNILYPTTGEITCNSMPIAKMGGDYRRLLGYLPQDFGYYPDFTAIRYLTYLSELKTIPKSIMRERVHELLELVGLETVRKDKIKTFSGGMIRRLGIAQAMLNNPEILILDEPTSGLDPKERIRFRNIISSFGKNRIVILSTHIVSDVEFIANNILLMKDGQFIESGMPEEITASMAGKTWECLVPENEAAHYIANFSISNLKNVGSQVKLRIVSDERPADKATLSEPTLEDVYLYYFQNNQN